jgi:hypothetical protein
LFGDVVPGAGTGEQPLGSVVHRLVVAAVGEVLVGVGARGSDVFACDANNQFFGVGQIEAASMPPPWLPHRPEPMTPAPTTTITVSAGAFSRCANGNGLEGEGVVRCLAKYAKPSAHFACVVYIP